MEQEPFNMFHPFLFFITASCSYANIDSMTTFMPINNNALYASWLKHDESFTEIMCSNEWNDYTMLEQRCIAFINCIQNDELTIGHVQLFPWTLIRETSIMFNILYYAGYDENIERIPVRQVLAACRAFHDDADMPVEYQREAFKALLAVESDSME